MDIEGFAVHAVEGVLLKCSRIKANIEKGDRVPLTDGHIDVYSSPSLTNENMLGRVAVQVKGRSVSKDYKFKEIESFQLERSTLEGYLHSKGVLFFPRAHKQEEDKYPQSLSRASDTFQDPAPTG